MHCLFLLSLGAKCAVSLKSKTKSRKITQWSGAHGFHAGGLAPQGPQTTLRTDPLNTVE